MALCIFALVLPIFFRSADIICSKPGKISGPDSENAEAKEEAVLAVITYQQISKLGLPSNLSPFVFFLTAYCIRCF